MIANKHFSSLKSLVPIFPNRLQTAIAKDRCNFGGRTFVTDFKLARGKLVFAVLIFRCNDSAADGAMQMLATLPRVTPGFGMAAGAHHGYSNRSQCVAHRRALACTEHDTDLGKRDAQRAHQLDKFAVIHRKEGPKSASRRT